jgi:hypothetical protein
MQEDYRLLNACVEECTTANYANIQSKTGDFDNHGGLVEGDDSQGLYANVTVKKRC